MWGSTFADLAKQAQEAAGKASALSVRARVRCSDLFLFCYCGSIPLVQWLY
jgi:hypothetical protein